MVNHEVQAARRFPKGTDDRTLVEAFTRDGYLVVQDSFGEALTALQTAIQAMFEPEARAGESIDETVIRLDGEDPRKLYRLAQLAGRLDAFFDVDRRCVPFAELLLPPGYVTLKENALLLGLPRNERLFYQWHQESSYITAYPNFLTYWIPVFGTTTVEGGTMSCLAGSHTLGLVPYDTERPSPQSSTSHIPRDIARHVEDHDEVHFLTDPGDLVMIHQDLIHRSTANASERVRFTGSVCLTSLSSTPELVQ